VSRLIDQFSMDVRPFFRLSNGRKLRAAGALQPPTERHQGHGPLGELISLAERRAARAAAAEPRSRPRASFFFDLASPWTYLAAERVDRLFAEVRWQPVIGDILRAAAGDDAERQAADDRAAQLRLPLVWPEAWPSTGLSAMRVATLAAEHGRAAPFVLAASRLAFCGGFDVDDPEILAEAAAAAGLGLDECLHAAGDLRRDGPLERASQQLLRKGADALPALLIARTLYCGEHRLAEAAAAASGRTLTTPSPLRHHG
jgi:2-hydroxychromene-2-carboxylate isomerase